MIILLRKKIVVNLQEKNPCKFAANIFVNILWEDFFLKVLRNIFLKISTTIFFLKSFKELICCRKILAAIISVGSLIFCQ